MTIGDKIKQLRGPMTLKEFAEIFQVSPSNISGIENNHSNPSFELASKICEHFNCTMDWLIRDIGSFPKEELRYQSLDSEIKVVQETNQIEDYKTKYIKLLEKHNQLLEDRIEKQDEKIRSNELQN